MSIDNYGLTVYNKTIDKRTTPRRPTGQRGTAEEFETRTSWKMSYAEYVACCCERCTRENCPHRDAFRRVPLIDGGLALCPNLRGLNAKH